MTAFDAFGMRDYIWRYPRGSYIQESWFDLGNPGYIRIAEVKGSFCRTYHAVDNVNARQIWNLALNLEAPIHSPIARPAGGLNGGITGGKTGSCGILGGPAADTKVRGSGSGDRPSEFLTRGSGPRQAQYGRKWLSGRASPCQGEGRGFESHLPLQHNSKSDTKPPSTDGGYHFSYHLQSRWAMSAQHKEMPRNGQVNIAGRIGDYDHASRRLP